MVILIKKHISLLFLQYSQGRHFTLFTFDCSDSFSLFVAWRVLLSPDHCHRPLICDKAQSQSPTMLKKGKSQKSPFFFFFFGFCFFPHRNCTQHGDTLQQMREGDMSEEEASNKAPEYLMSEMMFLYLPLPFLSQ